MNLPRFKIESKHELNAALASMDMADTCIYQEKQISQGMMSEPIYVSKVIQKTMIGVEEKGIMVAAIIMVGRSGRIRVTPVPQFIADHSFLFFLGDLEAGLLLLQGRIVDPTKNA